MIKQFNEFINFFDIGDFRFVLLILKKNIKNLIFLSLCVGTLVFVISLNIEKICK